MFAQVYLWHLLSYLLQRFFSLRSYREKLSDFFTAVIRAVSAVCHPIAYSTFSDLTDIAVTEMLPIFHAALAVYLLRLESASILLRPSCSHFPSLDIAVLMCSYEGYTIRTDQSAISNNFLHETTLFPFCLRFSLEEPEDVSFRILDIG